MYLELCLIDYDEFSTTLDVNEIFFRLCCDCTWREFLRVRWDIQINNFVINIHHFFILTHFLLCIFQLFDPCFCPSSLIRIFRRREYPNTFRTTNIICLFSLRISQHLKLRQRCTNPLKITLRKTILTKISTPYYRSYQKESGQV